MTFLREWFEVAVMTIVSLAMVAGICMPLIVGVGVGGWYGLIGGVVTLIFAITVTTCLIRGTGR